MRYFNFKSKYKLIKRFSSIFTIKTGSIFKADNGKCYKVRGWFSFLYKFYLLMLSSELALLLIIGLFLLVNTYINLWWLSIIVCSLIYFLVEIIFVALIPLDEVACWEKSLQEKEG